MSDRGKLEQAIAAQEGLRGVVPDDVVDAAIAALRRQLETSSSEDQRRRQVTVLFADVSGFTSMSARTDPEAVAGVMNEVWARLDTIITDHGGRVDKHIGDAVMAVWGVTATREDDPERAVRAGLALQEELARRGPTNALTMRVGINTGPAHLGAVGAGAEFTAMGDTVNVASRVQNLAPLGGVLVTHDTYRQIRGVFDVEELDAATVKGKDEPLRVYVVRRAKAHAFRMQTRGVEGVETQMIGRTDELDVLRAEFERVVGHPATRLASIIGDAGIGKSRLLYEFENWIDLHPAGAYFFKGRAVPTRQSAAFGLLRDLLGDRFGVLDSDAVSTVADKLRAGLGLSLTADEADLVGQWLGFDLRSSAAVQRLLASGQLASTARAHLLRYFEALASDAPVVVFLEDVHWADDESVALVEELIAALPELHLLLIAAARPAVLQRPEAERLLGRSSVTLHLQPLVAGAVRSLVEEILQKAESVPEDLSDLIVARADGNAFYVEELVMMLIEDGVIEARGPWDPWLIHLERLVPERVPATLTGVLQARLDSLTPPERDALQRSSVVGRVFWDGTVAALGDDGTDATVTATSLEVARQRELVLRREHSSFEENVEFSFKHALLRDVTYETVLLRDRERLHGLVAAWISDHAADRLVEFADLIATHHRLAGDLTAAADLLHRAAVALLDVGNLRGARRSLDEAFELWRKSAREPSVTALITMAEACVRLGDVGGAYTYSENALRVAVTVEDRVSALYLASWAAVEQGEHEREKALLDEALPLAERQGGVLLGRVLTALSWWAFERGDTGAARAYAERATVVADEFHHPMTRREAFGALGAIAGMDGDLRGSLRYSAQMLDDALEIGDLEGQARAHSNLGVAHHLLGDAGARDDYLAALDHYRAARSLDQRLGRRLSDAMTATNMAQIHVRSGNDLEARRLIHEAITVVREVEGTSTLLFCALAEADRRLTNGDVTSALELIGLVRRHPALTSDSEAEVERILGRANLPDDVIERGMARSAGQDFDAVIDRVAHELASAGGAS